MSPETGACRLMSVICLWLTLITGFFLGFFFFAGTELSLPIQLVFLAMVLLSANRWTGLFLLAAVQLHLFFAEPGRRSSIQHPGELLYVLATLGLLMFGSRFATLQEAGRLSLFAVVRSVWKFLTSRDVLESTPLSTAVWKSLLGILNNLFIRTSMLLVIMFGSFWLLSSMEISGNLRDWAEQLPGGERQARPSPWFMVAIAAVFIVLFELAWRQKTAVQAAMYLRSLLLQDLYPEFRMILSRRMQLRRKQLKDARWKSNPPPSNSQKPTP